MISKLVKKGKHKVQKVIDQRPNTKTFESDSFVRFLKKSSSANKIFVIIDARNPNSCRYVPYEDSVKEKVVLVLNKIDLVPREVAIGWYRFLNDTSQVFALSANTESTALQNFTEYVKSLNISEILITGVGNVGKKTLGNALRNIDGLTINLETWTWLQPTPDLAVLKAVEKMPSGCDLIFGVYDIIRRSSIQSLMEVFRITFFSDPDRLLQTINKQPQTAAIEFIDGMSSGKWPYYTAPQIQKSANGLTHQNHQEIELDDMERAMFANSLPYDAFETPFIMLGYGSINAMKPMIVNVLHQFSEKKTTTGK